MLREQRKLYVAQRDARGRRYEEDKERLESRVSELKLSDWCRDSRLRKAKADRLEELNEDLQATLPDQVYLRMMEEYSELLAQTTECDKKIAELEKLAALATTSKFDYNDSMQAVMTIDNKLRLLTNRSTF